ncbi:aldo/keto reductase [Listeria sp. FSL L7-1485]|uniref:Aldo/keto reductase n=1 Tax=Listeria immobilis TaxID=2713502 RepID=A0A7X0X4E8_9LIST|nr:aldo/keto reductase [Listeria immobilis]MBC1483627.1 aldo/keto reductase [Listeria immobilis]MBC1487431.1 aldo/keto reductase [Listeria immobilis]MBC1506737.1 aldo/keto reductase [Listeria immobilis]MBC1509744.1 aldo/keto reductase [Listeria immobilis]MBC1534810.1 aldo/keto reductase [Listeria immobilis]
MTLSFSDTYRLNNGIEMPKHGFGVYKLTDEKRMRTALETAAEVGYRLFDTASFYHNEKQLGDFFQSSGLNRNDFFVTTKMWNNEQGYDETLRAFEQSQKKLQLDQVDLYLVHWPKQDTFFETWRAVEKLYDEGLVRAIGVSNFEAHHLDRLRKNANVLPVIDQVETHPYFPNHLLHRYLEELHIVHQAWSPLGRGSVLKEPTLINLGQKHGKTPAQIVLRWHLQNDISIIPKSETPARIKENAAIYDFALDDKDMHQLDRLNTGERVSHAPDVMYIRSEV